MKSPRDIIKQLVPHITDTPPDPEDLATLMPCIQRYGTNANRFSVWKDGKERLRKELLYLVEDAASALAIIEGEQGRIPVDK